MMHKTKITSPGPMIDGRTLMPGTVLVTKSEPPASWRRFSEPDQTKQFVTNPAPQPDPVASGDSIIDELREDYETLTGNAPDKRWGERRLRDALEELASE